MMYRVEVLDLIALCDTLVLTNESFVSTGVSHKAIILSTLTLYINIQCTRFVAEKELKDYLL